MYTSALYIQVVHERYYERLAEACHERRIREACAMSARPSRAAVLIATLIERIVAALHFRRVAQI
jgi:hypothetical protein